jgi:hypothetical protein
MGQGILLAYMLHVTRGGFSSWWFPFLLVVGLLVWAACLLACLPGLWSSLPPVPFSLPFLWVLLVFIKLCLAGFHHFYYCSALPMRWEGNPITRLFVKLFGDQVHTSLWLIVCFLFFLWVVSTCVLFCLVLLLNGFSSLIFDLLGFFFHTRLATQDNLFILMNPCALNSLTHSLVVCLTLKNAILMFTQWAVLSLSLSLSYTY